MADDDVVKTKDERPGGRDRIDHADTLPAVAEDRPSTKLDVGGRYTLGDEIARGGMGRVVEATDKLLGRKVALKAALAGEPEAMRRFARETRVTARLEHPSIIPVYDAGHTSDGLPYYVMRKVAGRPLEALIHERRTIDERLGLLPNVLAAVEAVAHAHSRGVLHRDLKPGNILVGELGETVVIDWGLAKVIDEPDDVALPEAPSAGLDAELKTRAGQVVGTPGFMAPEQLHGEPATRACDVYALGSTLYCMLAGEPPHAARSSDEMIALALRGPPLPIDEVTSGVPGELVTILERAMAYERRERYADAGALAAELRRFLTGQLVASHEYSTVERAVRFVRRHRGAVAVTLIAAAVLGVVAYLSAKQLVRERNGADDARELALVEKQAAEQARASEAKRADDLLVSQAAALIATNPTKAVGLLHQLPPTATNWQKARDVLAEARVRGVPWVFPASGFTSGLVVGRDGSVAFSAGNDGIVRRHDLGDRSTKQIYRTAGNTLLALAGSDELLAVAGGTPQLTWIYLKTGALDSVPLARPIEQLATIGTTAVFHDGQLLWMLPHGESVPQRLEITATKVFGLVASPDGKHVLINAQPDTLVVEIPTARTIVKRPSRSMEPAWSRDGKRLAVASLQGLDEIDFTGATPATRTIASGNVQAAAYAGEDLYFTTGAQTGYRYHPRDGVVQINLPAATYSSVTSTRDAAVFVAMSGMVAVAGRGGTLAIRAPAPRMFRATGTAHATRFLVTVHEHLLLYDLADMLPKSLDTQLTNTTFHGFAGNGHFLMAYMQDDWMLFDIVTGVARSLGRLEFGTVIDAPADGSYVIARARDAREPLVLRHGQPPMGLTDARHAVALSPTTIALATEHDVAILELSGANRRTKLWSTAEPIRGIATAGPFVVAIAKTALWRRDVRSGAATTVEWTATPAAIDVSPAGDVWIAADTQVWKWAATGTLTKIQTLARPIRRLTYVDGIGCVAVDDRRSATLITEGAVPRAALPSDYELASLADAAPLISALTHDRRLVVYDLEARHLWALGAGETIAETADDGKHVATFANGQIAIYRVELPATRADYQRWLESTTNLRVAVDGANELVWPKR